MRKSFAVLLLGSWISLSGFDSLEAANLTAPIDRQLSGEEKSHPQRDFANHLLYAADFAICQPAITGVADFLPGFDWFAVYQKNGKLYKILRVFLL